MSSGGSTGTGARWTLAPLFVGVLAIVAMAVRGCDTGPFHRHRVLGLTHEQEDQLGAQAFQEVLSRSDVVRDGPAVDAVKRVGRRLAEASQRKDFLDLVQLSPRRFEWEFRLVRERQVNAFCLPGGKVVVYTGILPLCETEAGLATVLGHEIGHALASHGAERMAEQQMIQIGVAAVAGSLDQQDPQRRRQILAVLGAGATVGLSLPFSRKQESEADHIGLYLMAAAGYDPREAPRFWARMEKLGGRTPEILSTHPGPEHRERALQGWLKEALPLYESVPHADGNRPLPRP
jgi:predicted Zn-dependent protease